MPMKDFFACTTSPSTIVTAVQDTPVCETKRQRIEWSGLVKMVDGDCELGRGRTIASKKELEGAR